MTRRKGMDRRQFVTTAGAAAAAPAVVTNCRRSIPFRLVMDLPSIDERDVRLESGVGGQVPDSRLRAPESFQIVYITLMATWVAFCLPAVAHVVLARKYSTPSW